MKVYDPNSFAHTLPNLHRQWVQDVHKALSGGVSLGVPAAMSPSATSGVNAGVPTQYDQANGSGKLIRVDAAGVSAGASYNWGTSPVEIKHALGRVPIGFQVVDQDGAVQVFRTAPPTDQLITLDTSDSTVSTTLYIF